MSIIIFAFIIALFAVNFPMTASLIATNAKFNKEDSLKNGYGYFIGINTIATTAVTVIALIFVAKTCF